MKRVIIILLVLMCFCVGTDALAEEKERETISLGSKGQLVVCIQQRLMDLGYYTYKPTGSYQSVTRRSALAFERAAGTRQDGRLTPEEQDILFSGGAERAPYVANIPLSFTAQSGIFSVTGELWNWDEISEQLLEGDVYTIINCATTESCEFVYQGGESHAHMMPLPSSTYKNEQTIKQWLGESNSYYKIAVIVIIGEKRVAASMQYDNSIAHVFFQGSTSDVLHLADKEHDSLIQRAAGR